VVAHACKQVSPFAGLARIRCRPADESNATRRRFLHQVADRLDRHADLRRCNPVHGTFLKKINAALTTFQIR